MKIMRLINFSLNIIVFLITLTISLSLTASEFKKIWEFELSYSDKSNTVQSQPSEYKDLLILVDGAGHILALNKINGQLIYKKYIGAGAGRRGFEIDRDNEQIVIIAGKKLKILDIQTGNTINSVKTQKSIVAPVITSDCYIVFGLHGIIQCHNKLLSEIKWQTNLGSTARVWSNALWIPKYNLVYFVTSNPGGLVEENRGDDKYSSSLIAINIINGSISFNHQMIDDDVWDYDGVGKPIFIENFRTSENLDLDLVIGLNKTGTIFAVQAEDGKFVQEKQFIKKNSQTIPLWPDRISNIKITKEDLRIEQVKPNLLRHAKFREFLPSSVDYDLVVKGLHGGPQWHGGTYYNDAEMDKKILAIPTNNLAWILRVNYVQKSPALLKILTDISKPIRKVADIIEKKVINKISAFLFSKKINDDQNLNNEVKSRWIQEEWSGEDFNSQLSNKYYKYIDYKSSNSVYKNNCASCHRYDRRGKYQTELSGDGYIPSLVGLTLTDKYKYSGIYNNFKLLHNNDLNISEQEFKNLFKFFDKLDKKLLKEKQLYKDGFWQVLLGKDSLPLNKGPWGSVSIVELKSGKLINKVTVGEMTNSKGEKVNSSIIFGGIGQVNDRGESMLVGTVDPKAYFISIPKAKVIDTVKLKRPGSVNPFLTEINGCEAWIIIETGGRFSFFDRSMNGFTVEAFAKKDNC